MYLVTNGHIRLAGVVSVMKINSLSTVHQSKKALNAIGCDLASTTDVFLWPCSHLLYEM